MLGRRGHARQVRGVDDEHGVELVPHRWPRLDVLHACQQQCGEQIAITEPAMDALGDAFQQLILRRLFEQAHNRRDLRLQPQRFFIEPRFVRRDGIEL
jgi:hypothetical protein